MGSESGMYGGGGVRTGHKWANVALVFVLAAAFALTLVVNIGAGTGALSGILNNSVGNLSRKYPTDITPASYAFSIWSLIFIYLLVCYAFYIFTLFKTNKDGGKIYLNPEILTVPYLVVTIVNIVLLTAWVFIWDREELVGASVTLFLIAATNVLSLAILSKNLAARYNALKEERPKLYWTYVVLAQNGPALYTTWTVIASLLNLIHALHYVGGVSMFTCTTVSLVLLMVVLVCWFVIENVFVDSYVRYVVTQYPVVIWTGAAILVAQDSQDPAVPAATRALSVTILALAAVLLVARIAVIAYRETRGRSLGRVDVN